MESLTTSIALCTYNGGPFLRAQLDSFLAQTTPAQEIVVVDDQSTDDTEQILLEYKNRLPLKIHKNPVQLGFVKNFERALSLCQNEIIFLSDQDDIWHANKIETLLQTFQQNPDIQLVFSNSRLVDEAGKDLGKSSWEAIHFTEKERASFRQGEGQKVLLKKAVVAGNTIALKRNFLQKALPIPNFWIHDEWLMALAVCNGSVSMMEEELISYRQHHKQSIGAVGTGLQQRLKKRIQRANRFRWESFSQEHQKWQSLQLRVENSSALLAEKISFQREKAGYAQLRLLRTWPILKNLALGKYHRFSAGFSTALRDWLASGDQ